MAEYIEREALAAKITDIKLYVMLGRCSEKSFFHAALREYRGAVLKAIAEAPAADVAEVRHGHDTKDTPSLFECSVCGWSCWDTYPGDTDEYNFCPNCGAKMDNN